MTKGPKFALTKWGVGLYVVFIMFFGGVFLLWTIFDWLCSSSSSPWYHVAAFGVSMTVCLVYEYWAVRILDWIADKLDV